MKTTKKIEELIRATHNQIKLIDKQWDLGGCDANTAHRIAETRKVLIETETDLMEKLTKS